MRTFDEIMASDIESKLQALSGLTELVNRADVVSAADVKEYMAMYTRVLQDQLQRFKGANNE